MLTKVLVVDDDKEMTELLKVILEPNSFEVYSATSGTEGVQLAQEMHPDIILLDLMMPGMDGWQVCKEIRQFTQVPILVLSAINKPGIVARALDEGADDYLLKPMPSGVLIAHLRKLLRRSRSEHESSQPKMDFLL